MNIEIADIKDYEREQAEMELLMKLQDAERMVKDNEEWLDLEGTVSETELARNALLLYPYILNQTISHGRAAEILGIGKSELIDLYDRLGYSYFDMTLDELDDELNTFKQLKK